MVAAIDNPAILALYADRNQASVTVSEPMAEEQTEAASVEGVPSYPSKKLVLQDGCYRVVAPEIPD